MAFTLMPPDAPITPTGPISAILMNLMRLGVCSNSLMNLLYCCFRLFLAPLRGVMVLFILMGFLAACGEPQTQVETANTFLLDARGSAYLAFQDGPGEWQLLSGEPDAQGLTTVSLSDPQGRYGVMSVCLDEESGGAVAVQIRQGLLPSIDAAAGTAATPPLVRLGCGVLDTATERMEVRGPVRGLDDGEYGSLYLGSVSALIDASTSVAGLELQGSSASELDLIATKYAPDALLPSALVVESGLELSPGGVTPIDLDFTAPEAVALVAAEVPLTGQQPNELLSGSVAFLTRSGTRALLGESVFDGALGYARPPESLLREAALQVEAQSFSYNDRTKAGSSRSVSRTFWGGAVAPLELPPSLELQAPGLTGSADSLRPRASWKALPAEGNYAQFYSQVRAGNSVSYRFSQSRAFLERRFPSAATYTQVLPDFSGLPGWRAEWNLARGDDIFWDVSFRTETAGRSASSSRSGVLRTTLDH